MLVTLDTAIKHLATWTGTPIVEIALGSSNPNETGAYQEGALILKPQVPCAPCRHSSSCSQSSFVCQEDLSVNSVFAAIQLQLQLLNENNKAIKSRLLKNTILAFLDENQNKNYLNPIHYVHSSQEGWWSCNPLLKFKKGENNEGRNKKSVEIDYQANR